MLTKLDLPQTEDTPKIVLDSEKGIFEFVGKSLPEDANTIYSPVKEWIKEYKKNPKDETEIIFKIDYFNSSSAKKFMELFMLMEEMKDHKTSIKWYYQKGDRLIKARGEEYKSILDIPFEVIVSE